MTRSIRVLLLALLTVASFLGVDSSLRAADISVRLAPKSVGPEKASAAVIWLKPLHDDPSRAVAPGRFTLVQKNKTFTPHLLVVPMGSSVAFPNTDPFFHNVFSLFDGKRFDLGLYEAGSTRSVLFSREGISYIFCNIHSEMSAVVISLNTPYFSIADSKGEFRIAGVPSGDYDLYVWIEGQRQNSLDKQTRRIHVGSESADLGEIRPDEPEREPHRNKFGRSYDVDAHPIY
ncbi:hypothetical protein [Edaphobacter modestus]|uniref:Plastocyanin n=1 Tax=Edaphobacter modestus TaxID=388466 RepID=A0A4Q7YY04_9BACT|nr:hypothetical protein [Edaphobacter modestus]RZU42344.1 hypothetical protein BDD14_3909 [Edaphobacter modestus]